MAIVIIAGDSASGAPAATLSTNARDLGLHRFPIEMFVLTTASVWLQVRVQQKLVEFTRRQIDQCYY